jgi:hypothetical protein
MTPRRILLPAAAALGLLTLLLVAVIATGAFDPQPAGPQTLDLSLGETVIATQDEQLVWLEAIEATAAQQATTWQLTAAFTGGNPDMGYGLALGDAGRALVVAASPLGYAVIWERDAAGNTLATHLPWQTWPHVRTGQSVNELWVDVVPGDETDQVAVRLNRELLWQGTVAPLGGSAGLWAVSFGDESAVTFQRLLRFDSTPTARATE